MTDTRVEVPGFSTLVDMLRYRAERQEHERAFLFLAGREEIELTYAQLDRNARAIAAELQSLGEPGDRVLLLYPSGLDYISAFFGCLYAGRAAVPVYPPRPGRSAARLYAVVQSAGAKVALTNALVLKMVQARMGEDPFLDTVTWRATDALPEGREQDWAAPKITPQTLAFLQYTSGSTASPKGVMLDHENLLHNERMMSDCFDTRSEFRAVGWLPLYHDMGLIGNVLQPLWRGGPCVLMAPESFLMRPFRWLEAMSRFKATSTGAPNFGYELCVKKIKPEQRETLDLSSWKVAYNGAEPIRAESLERFAETFAPQGFRPEAFCPCYGLAEATLLVSGADIGEPVHVEEVSASGLKNDRVVAPTDAADVRRIVSCGHAWLGQDVVVVDPKTRVRCPADAVGEIWVHGRSVAKGYWGAQMLTQETFQARIEGEDNGKAYLRTGDLGFIRDNLIYVTGRHKDLIIVGGQNYYPQDIERVVDDSHPAMRPGCTAAFSIDHPKGEKIIVCAEIRQRLVADLQSGGLGAVHDAIRKRVFDEEGVALHEIVLLRQGTIPKTSSGKIQRRATKAQYLDRSLQPVEAPAR